MKSKLLGAVFAAALAFDFSAGSANAITFDVTGSNIFGENVTGTIDGDATLTVINAINLQFSAGNYTVINSYVPNVLVADTNPHFIFEQITLFFSSTDANQLLDALTAGYQAAHINIEVQHAVDVT